MDGIMQYFKEMLNETTYKIILSKPKKNQNTNYRKIVIDKVSEEKYLIEKYTAKQVFHTNMIFDEAFEFVIDLIKTDFSSCNAWDEKNEYSFYIDRVGNINFSKKKHSKTAPTMRVKHNKDKKHIIEEGTIIEPLIDLGIFTAEGKIIKGMYNKFKQINRILEIINDEMEDLKGRPITVVDYGCGKSYLTYILYYYFKEIKNIDITMIGVDEKKDVIDNCNNIAKKYNYENLKFIVGDIGNYEYDGEVDIVIALHACDTATDYALFNAIRKNIKLIFAAPCCQHELFGQIKSDKYKWLIKHGVIKERFSSLITDAIRCNILEYYGYKTQLVEFVPFEHTPKNILIRAVKKRDTVSPQRLDEVKSLAAEFNLDPTLLRLINM